ncbi:MAG: GNAT family N-acetyltransferase [Acidimicrobiia bacterium]
MGDPIGATLAGTVVAVTAERRAEEQAELLAKRGAEVVHVPTVHTVDLTADDELRARTEQVIAAPPDWLVATTGFGMRLWFEAADSWGLGDDLVAALGSGRVVARGPKAQSACRQRGLEVVWRAPRESMAEVVAWLADQPGIAEASVVLQLFDPGDHPSTADVEAAAGSVLTVPLYRWRLPDDVDAVRSLAGRIARRELDAVTFTSQPAVRFLLEVAEAEGRRADVVAAFDDGAVVPVCVGPVCAEALVEAGIGTAVWPEPFRLVPMVKLAEEVLSGVRFERVDPRDADAVAAVGAYVAEVDSRFPHGFDAGEALLEDADRLAPPTGAFVVARRRGEVVGCGGVQTIGDGVGEIKRMWVSPSVRGQGVGRSLLSELERRSRRLGHRLVRLDTNATLTEAIAMYAAAGYEAIERYNDNPYAERFFEKRLEPAAQPSAPA